MSQYTTSPNQPVGRQEDWDGVSVYLGQEPRATDTPRPDLDRFAYEHHWERADGSIYTVDSSD